MKKIFIFTLVLLGGFGCDEDLRNKATNTETEQKQQTTEPAIPTEQVKTEAAAPINQNQYILDFRILDEESDDMWVKTNLSGKHLSRSYHYDTEMADNIVFLEFNSEGKRLLYEITSKNIGKRMGIFIDNVLISDPTIYEALSDGEAVIQGNFTDEQVAELTNKLNSTNATK